MPLDLRVFLHAVLSIAGDGGKAFRWCHTIDTGEAGNTAAVRMFCEMCGLKKDRF